MKNVFFAAFFGAACCLSGCRQEAATPATGEHYAFAEEMFRKVWDMYRVPEYGLFSEYYPNSYRPDVNYFDDGAKSTQEVSFLWPMDGVFTSAVALAEVDPVKYGCYVDSMVMAVEQYYDDGRMPAGYQAYPVRMGKVDRYYDDNGLVGLAYVAAYGVTRNPAHLEKAEQVMTFILSGWRPDHDGAVSWLEGVENQKPGCANGKAMLLALNLYGATGDPYYLTAGRRFYDWMDAYLHDPELDIVWNSWLTQPEARLDKAVYSYNTGLLLQGAVALYGYTGDRVYLDNARRLAEGARKFYLPETPDGAAANRDLPWFYLVLLRGYQALYDLDGDPKYVDIFIRWMDWARRNARDAAGLFYNDWSGKKDESATPKWLLDEACIPEYFVRAALIRREVVPAALPR